MHPPLAPHLHGAECRKIIELLNQCHSDHPLGKFAGVCNDLKRQLNKCLQKEYVERRQKNYESAQKRKQAFQKLYKED